jgi:hypothetical protein
MSKYGPLGPALTAQIENSNEKRVSSINGKFQTLNPLFNKARILTDSKYTKAGYKAREQQFLVAVQELRNDMNSFAGNAAIGRERQWQDPQTKKDMKGIVDLNAWTMLLDYAFPTLNELVSKGYAPLEELLSLQRKCNDVALEAMLLSLQATYPEMYANYLEGKVGLTHGVNLLE